MLDTAFPKNVFEENDESQYQQKTKDEDVQLICAKPMRKTITFVAVFFLLAPFWTPFVQTVGRHHTFARADALVLVALTLFGGLVCSAFLPNRCLLFVDALCSWFSNYHRFIVIALFFLLFLGLVAVNRSILHSFMNSADEHSCYFLAECIRNGTLWARPHPLSEFFEVAHVGNRDGKWFSVYPPGWPFIFALSLQLNIGDFINPLMAVLAAMLFFLIARRLYGSVPASLGILLMVSTPFFLFNNASYYSHTTCFLTTAIFLYSYLRWKESGNDWWSIFAALAVGYGMGVRYLTMAAILGPYLLYELIHSFKKRSWNRGHIWFSCVLIVLVVLNLCYNHLITGNWFDPPNHYHHDWEHLGFQTDYTLVDALIFIVSRFFYLIDWIPGVLVLVYFAYVAQHLKGGIQPILFPLSFIFLVGGYALYYSWGGNQYGPRYYFEGTPFIVLPVGYSLVQWWSEGGQEVKKFLAGLFVATLLGNFYLFSKHAVFFERVSRERKALYELAERSLSSPSVVFIRGFLGDTLIMSEGDSARNHPSLKGLILYARDLGQKNEMLMGYYQDRRHFVGYFDRKNKLPKLEPLSPLPKQISDV